MTRREFRDLADPAAARTAIDALDIDPGTTTVPLDAATGRTVSRRIDASIDVPGFERSAMDGYAVHASDTVEASEPDPRDLDIVGTLSAGVRPDRAVEPGEAIRVETGAVLPPGADAVVPVERCREGDDRVGVETTVAPGDSVMARGTDIAAGDRAIGPGTRLAPRHIGVLAALGRQSVPVCDRVRVAVVSTGGELRQPGTDLDHAAGEIYDVNGQTIAAAVERAGGAATRRPPVGDDPDAIRDRLESAAAESDLLVTSGSTSAGTVDVVPDLCERHGEIAVHGVALKPGRPLLVGRIFETPFVGLPGYPVSAMTVFRALLAPRLREATGQPTPATATSEATLATPSRYDGGRLRLVPVGLVADEAGSLVAYTLDRGSGATTSLVETDGLIRMPPETNVISRGEQVSVDRFDADAPIPSLLAVGDPDPVGLDVLDRIETRHLTMAPDDATRWLADDIPDLLVTALDSLDGADPVVTWERTIGVVSQDSRADPPAAFATLDATHALRQAFDAMDGPTHTSDGETITLPGLESAARAVAAGRAEAGLALVATAERLDLEVEAVGTQRMALVANPDRRQKTSVATTLDRVHDRLAAAVAETPGYTV
ncbi:MAG: gephyrin-like molybdotransferase Glp [Halococcoides sp.]